jgi:hypothetical protein
MRIANYHSRSNAKIANTKSGDAPDEQLHQTFLASETAPYPDAADELFPMKPQTATPPNHLA